MRQRRQSLSLVDLEGDHDNDQGAALKLSSPQKLSKNDLSVSMHSIRRQRRQSLSLADLEGDDDVQVPATPRCRSFHKSSKTDLSVTMHSIRSQRCSSVSMIMANGSDLQLSQHCSRQPHGLKRAASLSHLDLGDDDDDDNSNNSRTFPIASRSKSTLGDSGASFGGGVVVLDGLKKAMSSVSHHSLCSTTFHSSQESSLWGEVDEGDHNDSFTNTENDFGGDFDDSDCFSTPDFDIMGEVKAAAPKMIKSKSTSDLFATTTSSSSSKPATKKSSTLKTAAADTTTTTCWEDNVASIRTKLVQPLQKAQDKKKKSTSSTNKSSQHQPSISSPTSDKTKKKKKTFRTKKKKSYNDDCTVISLRRAVKDIQPDNPLSKKILKHMRRMSLEMEQKQ